MAPATAMAINGQAEHRQAALQTAVARSRSRGLTGSTAAPGSSGAIGVVIAFLGHRHDAPRRLLDAHLPAHRQRTQLRVGAAVLDALVERAATARTIVWRSATRLSQRRDLVGQTLGAPRNSAGRSAARCRRRHCRPASAVARRPCATSAHSMRPGASEPISATSGIGASPGFQGNCSSKPRSTSKNTKSAASAPGRQFGPAARPPQGRWPTSWRDSAFTVGVRAMQDEGLGAAEIRMRATRLTTLPSSAGGRRSRRGRSGTDRGRAQRLRCGLRSRSRRPRSAR